MALSKTNETRWVYTGHQVINKTQNNFKPTDLVATKSDNIIVADSGNHMIHILSNSGQCIYYLITRDQLSIMLPFSLDIDNKGTLYIGCSRYKSEPEEAKIYTVQVSGL